MKWEKDGKYSHTSGDWRVTGYKLGRGWVYLLMHKGQRRELYKTEKDAKEAAEKWKP